MYKLYTAVGKLNINKKADKRYPTVKNNQKEYMLDIQEFIIWTNLCWQITSIDELKVKYNRKISEIKYESNKSFDECVCRLLQRDIIAEGCGETEAEALYGLLSDLLLIPVSDNALLKARTYLHLTLIDKMPMAEAKCIFSKDKKDTTEKQVMRLAKSLPLSTAEIINCIDKNILNIKTEHNLIDTLYNDYYTTSYNISDSTRNLSKCRIVLSSIANLYLRKQIIFERI